jgi:hypothetical protein
VLGDGRLGERERLGRGGERTASRNLAQNPHSSYVEHQYSLSLTEEVFIWTDDHQVQC